MYINNDIKDPKLFKNASMAREYFKASERANSHNISRSSKFPSVDSSLNKPAVSLESIIPPHNDLQASTSQSQSQKTQLENANENITTINSLNPDSNIIPNSFTSTPSKIDTKNPLSIKIQDTTNPSSPQEKITKVKEPHKISSKFSYNAFEKKTPSRSQLMPIASVDSTIPPTRSSSATSIPRKSSAEFKRPSSNNVGLGISVSKNKTPSIPTIPTIPSKPPSNNRSFTPPSRNRSAILRHKISLPNSKESMLNDINTKSTSQIKNTPFSTSSNKPIVTKKMTAPKKSITPSQQISNTSNLTNPSKPRFFKSSAKVVNPPLKSNFKKPVENPLNISSSSPKISDTKTVSRIYRPTRSTSALSNLGNASTAAPTTAKQNNYSKSNRSLPGSRVGSTSTSSIEKTPRPSNNSTRLAPLSGRLIELSKSRPHKLAVTQKHREEISKLAEKKIPSILTPTNQAIKQTRSKLTPTLSRQTPEPKKPIPNFYNTSPSSQIDSSPSTNTISQVEQIKKPESLSTPELAKNTNPPTDSLEKNLVSMSAKQHYSHLKKSDNAAINEIAPDILNDNTSKHNKALNPDVQPSLSYERNQNLDPLPLIIPVSVSSPISDSNLGTKSNTLSGTSSDTNNIAKFEILSSTNSRSEAQSVDVKKNPTSGSDDEPIFYSPDSQSLESTGHKDELSRHNPYYIIYNLENNPLPIETIAINKSTSLKSESSLVNRYSRQLSKSVSQPSRLDFNHKIQNPNNNKFSHIKNRSMNLLSEKCFERPSPATFSHLPNTKIDVSLIKSKNSPLKYSHKSVIYDTIHEDFYGLNNRPITNFDSFSSSTNVNSHTFNPKATTTVSISSKESREKLCTNYEHSVPNMFDSATLDFNYKNVGPINVSHKNKFSKGLNDKQNLPTAIPITRLRSSQSFTKQSIASSISDQYTNSAPNHCQSKYSEIIISKKADLSNSNITSISTDINLLPKMSQRPKSGSEGLPSSIPTFGNPIGSSAFNINNNYADDVEHEQSKIKKESHDVKRIARVYKPFSTNKNGYPDYEIYLRNNLNNENFEGNRISAADTEISFIDSSITLSLDRLEHLANCSDKSFYNYYSKGNAESPEVPLDNKSTLVIDDSSRINDFISYGTKISSADSDRYSPTFFKQKILADDESGFSYYPYSQSNYLDGTDDLKFTEFSKSFSKSSTGKVSNHSKLSLNSNIFSKDSLDINSGISVKNLTERFYESTANPIEFLSEKLIESQKALESSRGSVLKEISESESTYLSDLYILKELFYDPEYSDPGSKVSGFNESDKIVVFSNLNDVISLTEKVVFLIASVLKNETDSINSHLDFPAVFLEIASEIESVYSTYCLSFEKALNRLTEILIDSSARLSNENNSKPLSNKNSHSGILNYSEKKISMEFKKSLSRGKKKSLKLRNHFASSSNITAILSPETIEYTKSVSEFLNSQQKLLTGKTSSWDLRSLLIKPVQRVLKYHLLLARLAELTTEKSNKRYHLAANMYTSVAENVNKAGQDPKSPAFSKSSESPTASKTKFSSSSTELKPISSFISLNHTAKDSGALNYSKKLEEFGKLSHENHELKELILSLNSWQDTLGKILKNIHDWEDSFRASMLQLNSISNIFSEFFSSNIDRGSTHVKYNTLASSFSSPLSNLENISDYNLQNYSFAPNEPINDWYEFFISQVCVYNCYTLEISETVFVKSVHQNLKKKAYIPLLQLIKLCQPFQRISNRVLTCLGSTVFKRLAESFTKRSPTALVPAERSGRLYTTFYKEDSVRVF
ncbi:hypothetical protein AYI70_g12339 [Smittium culicis]|uniref:DH domain-containing protein n=1 Tax=Smittium culicis TaxID=133412 RepID=A0A1R1WXZ6_9FUNG|nr:hypothetical protein AYI70_g12339 [Smittium culicis]